MRERSVRMTILIATLGMAAASCATRGSAEQHIANANKVERGKYLVTIGGCNDCHTPFKLGPNGPEPDMTRMLSGHPQSVVMPPVAVPGPEWAWAGAATNTAFSGPWGTSYAFNLTPDEHTGIGIWNEEIFVNTIRTGRHWGVARPILPPMPWFNYRQMTDDDLRAVYAFLRSIPAVRNKVPDAVIASESSTD